MHRAMRIALLASLVLAFAPAAHAYLDAGTGGMILQVIAGGVAGAAVAIKMFWHRIKGFFGGGKGQHDDPPA